ncbi:MAG: ATP-dependent Clp protease adaptor ClpS [Bacteroidia bacterium]|nr:ATP-dependent Clp protease adaptor ClpS [Bacteroidia bacterium]
MNTTIHVLPNVVDNPCATIVDTYQLVLFNDEVNTFEWVIRCLIRICNHTSEQAEQCAWFIHYKGKYSVLQGSYDKLEPYCTALLDAGLSAKIES